MRVYFGHWCPDCELIMVETDDYSETEVDESRMIAWGFDPRDYEEWNEEHRRFSYVHPIFRCPNCQTGSRDTKRYYFDPDTRDYTAPRPLTPQQTIAAENRAQEDAGQLVMWEMLTS